MKSLDLNITSDIRVPEKLKLYRQIFWEAPWKEWYICRNCWRLYPLSFWANCDCNTPKLIPFYVPKELKNEFDVISQSSWYKELIAKVLDRPVWFIWWWQTNLSKLNSDKLWLEEDEFSKLEDSIVGLYSDFNFNSFYYFSEIGVMKDFRWKDVAWKLYREFTKQIKKSWDKYVVVRTTKKTEVPYNWFKDMWYKDVYSYEDEQDRVILVLNLDENETSS